MNKSKSTQMDRIHRNSRIPWIPARISGGMKSIGKGDGEGKGDEGKKDEGKGDEGKG